MTAAAEPLLTPAEVAGLLRVSESWLRAKVRAEAVPHLRLHHRSVRFTAEHVQQIAATFEVTPRRRP